MSGKSAKQQRKLDRQHRLFWGSSYDRGLDIILFMWPDIKERFPDAELHICYGWDLFDKVTINNPERQQWKKNVQAMMDQEGVIHHGRVGKKELANIRKQCGIWAYPTYFTEINCINALEAQKDGLVPVTMTLAALDETVGSGVKIAGDIKQVKVQDEYLSELLRVMSDVQYWKEESQKAKEFASQYSWENSASEWDKVLSLPTAQPFVSVVTITIRTGFWNIMSENLSRQTYKNFEWIIIDDYKEDRSELAKKYAKQYNLNIKYLRGDKVLEKYNRRYGLVRANNKAWKNASGELLVFLQDFILIPERGIENLVMLYGHHPEALLAPTDDYFHCVEPNKDNKEDWFDGELDIVTDHSWRNIRNKYEGIRRTDNPFDFEMNWGAIPKATLEKLNGWWEFFDDGLGFDNTEIAYRAIKAKIDIIVDDTNVATCINLWPHIGGTDENIKKRERYLGVPYYVYLKNRMEQGELRIVRDEKLDESIKLEIKVPDEIKDEDCANWIEDHADQIAKEWVK